MSVYPRNCLDRKLHPHPLPWRDRSDREGCDTYGGPTAPRVVLDASFRFRLLSGRSQERPSKSSNIPVVWSYSLLVIVYFVDLFG